MWKRLLVLALLVQRKLIASEQVNGETENKRTSRQLNFGDCCPCPGQATFHDLESATTRLDAASVGDDSCPCRSTSDSEGASSMFRPVFRAIDPSVSTLPKKEERKPLLNPEVGLASSVLETLREVTDQEYQEALERDAARSASKIMDPEISEIEPSNVVNIILSPKEENNDDIISEATENKGTSCILPPLSTNTNEHLRLQPPMKLLKQLLTPPKISSNGILNRNRFDMDGSASNTQERLLQPLKNNIVDNIMTRSNLLNLRPLSNTDNRDFLTSPNILQKYYMKNNIKDRMLLRNRPLLDVQPKATNKHKGLFTKNTVGYEDSVNEPDETPGFNSVKKLEMPDEDNILQSTACMEMVKEANMSLKDNLKDFDAVPSSSKTIEVKNPNIIETPNIMEQDTEADTFNDKVLDKDINTSNLNTLQTVTEINRFPENSEVTTEVIGEDAKFVDKQNNDSEIEITTEHLDNLQDMDSEPSITRNIVRNFQDAENRECASSTKGKSNNEESPENLMSSYAEKDKNNSEIKPLPNIKANIYRTLENFKKANEKIQEKLRSNVQNALQSRIPSDEPHKISVNTDTQPHSEIHASSGEQSREHTNSITTTKKNITTQDLQKMSDSLLKVALKDDSESSTISYNNEELKENQSAEIVEEVSDKNDMITSPTTLNLKNDTINLKNIDGKINKNVETVENICDNKIIVSKNSDFSKINNEHNEMTAQPSNSVFNSISRLDLDPSKLGLLHGDSTVQLQDKIEPMEGIKDFFNNLRSSKTDAVTNDAGRSVLLANQPRLGYKKDINDDSSNGISGDYMPKFNYNSNLSSYKAKVASPKSLDIKSLVPTPPLNSDKDADILGLASQRIPQTSNYKNLLKNNVGSGLNPLFKPLHNPKMLQDTFSSIVPSLPERVQSHSNNIFKSFRDSVTLGEREPLRINQNNLLGESLINPDNLFGAMLKTHEDFNDRLQTFHSDLNRRISSISPKTPFDSSRLLWPESRLKNSKNGADFYDVLNKNIRTLPGKTKSSTMKNTILLKNTPIMESIKKKTADAALRSNKNAMLRHNAKPKVSILPQQTNVGLKKGPIAINTHKSYLNTKKTPKHNIKIKPLKENKVTISFATTTIQPNTLKSGFKPLHPTDSLRSRSTVGSVKLPKFSKSSDKKPTLKSKLELNDPEILASDIKESKVKLPRISVEESESVHSGNQNNENRRFASRQEANRRKSLLLSKLKNAFPTGTATNDMKRNNNLLLSTHNENGLDASQSASNTVDTSISAVSLAGETPKDNQQFKCKMVCIKDFLESKDT
ncbi:jg864 [Pararge aegeria aegeria]|uniref:Jg864 protein n=1 Tax=Pararge aegeria aegeria TaxID=348720 RepID=A0A8S4RUB6_9NEOP|nr:jg864 [Pararge aegeria aegeria]